MHGHAASIHDLDYDNKMRLLDEKSMSDSESDVGRTDLESKLSGYARHRAWQPPAFLNGPRSIIRRTALFLLPSFVQARLTGARGSGARPGPTAYLDGMRGLAALFVFFCHYSYTCFIIAPSWGHDDGHYHILSLPFIRLFYSGPPMVCVFFVVSGYALSLRPLRLARARSFDALANTMSSFTFRRLFRLYLPSAISTLLITMAIRVGLYEWTREFANDDVYLRNVHEPHYKRFDTASEQYWAWAKSMFNFVHIFDWGLYTGQSQIDVHLWTIPVEFRCSMMLFLTLIATARLKTSIRFLVVASLMTFVYYWARWDMVLFYAGMILAELDLIRGAHNSPSSTSTTSPSAAPLLPTSPPTTPTNAPPSIFKRAAWLAVSILGLYFMSQPDKSGADTPGWVYLTSLIPKWWKDEHRYWQSVGAVLFVLAVGRSPGWQRFFNTAVVQYFGKISYAIYLMHGPVQHTVGYATMRWVWGWTGIEGGWYRGGYALAAVVVVPIVIWVSDVFWRAVDAPVVRFAKWLEGVCSIEE